MRLMHGDCLELMRDIPYGSVDMILCDLPYGTTACHWDTVIPFEPLWAHYKRVIKKNGAIVLTGSQPFTSALVMSNVEWFRHSLIWEKNIASNFQHANNQHLKIHEDILIFGRGGLTYNPQWRNGNPYQTKGRVRARPDTLAPKSSCANYTPAKISEDGRRYPQSIIRIDKGNDYEHPTQKPVPLMAYLIATYTNKGETVLDNCMGSGTIGVACVQTGREFIGIEMDAGYFKTAKKRIEAAAAQATLEFAP